MPTSLPAYLIAAGGLLLLAILGVRLLFARAHIRHIKRQLADENRQGEIYRIACFAASDGLVLQRMDGTVIWANDAYCAMMGYRLDEIVGRNPLSFCLPEDETPPEDEIAAFRYDPVELENDQTSLFRNQRKSGEMFWIQITTALHRRFSDEDEDRVVLVCRDATQQVEAEEELRKLTRELAHVAHHDSLTGAANRTRLLPFVETALSEASDQGDHVGFLQIDLDEFKAINDNLGHAAGDTVLEHVADCARGALRDTDLLARTGGDEFVAVCPGIPDIETLNRIGTAILTAVRTTLAFDGREVVPSVSIGGALSRATEDAFDDLLRRSDFALYEAKRAGRGRVHIYDAALHARFKSESRRADELRATVNDKKLHFHFQPTVSLTTGEIRGLEALCRWQKAPDTLLRPSEFFPLAVDLGLMAQIDRQALDATCALRRRLIDDGFAHIRTGANVSAAFLSFPGMIDVVKDTLDRHDIDAAGLVIEISEDVVFAPKIRHHDITDTVVALHDLGLSVLIDNFGADYADLMAMGELSISGFKTSKALTSGLSTNMTSRRIAAMIKDVTEDLGLYAVHIGVETPQQLSTLACLGAGVAQGNALCPPIPPSDITAMLRAHDPAAILAAAGKHHQLPPPDSIAI